MDEDVYYKYNVITPFEKLTQKKIKTLEKRLSELEHYQSLLMGKDIGMSSIWSRFDELEKKIGDLSVEHGNMFKALKSALFPRLIKIENSLEKIKNTL